MKRIFLALLMVCAFAADAAACHRCGIFGRGCRFVQSYAASYYPQAYQAAATQNFVFNNTYPVPYLSQQGQSVYGYSLAATPYSVDSAAVLDRAARLQELTLETAQTGINGFNATAASMTALADAVDRRTKNAMVALATIQANQQQPAQVAAAGQVQTVTTRYTVRNGQIVVENEPGTNGNGQQDFSAAAINTLQVCARCHDGQGTHHEPRDVVLDGSRAIDWAMYERCFEQVRTGKMPKGGLNITAEQRFAILKALPRLMAGQPSQLPAPAQPQPQPQPLPEQQPAQVPPPVPRPPDF